MPIPGATISAMNAATKEQIYSSTDVDGSYSLRVPVDGQYTVRVQMAAFAEGTQEVVLDAAHPDVQVNFELILVVAGARGRRENVIIRSAAAGECGWAQLPESIGVSE